MLLSKSELIDCVWRRTSV